MSHLRQTEPCGYRARAVESLVIAMCASKERSPDGLFRWHVEQCAPTSYRGLGTRSVKRFTRLILYRVNFVLNVYTETPYQRPLVRARPPRPRGHPAKSMLSATWLAGVVHV